MRPPLLLTGPPAAGKSTTARALARSVPVGAVIDVDDVRQLVVAGHAAPWEGEEGRRQQLIGVENACDLARRFLRNRIEVVLADVLTAATEPVYRRELPGLRVVRLQLPLAEGRRRARLRPAHLTDQEFDALYELDAVGGLDVDHVLDVADLDLDQQARAVGDIWVSSRP